MSFEYYCTNCGRKITQNDVLFDLQYIITRDKNKRLNILKFRMPLNKLTALYNSGVPTEGGFRKITLTLKQFLNIVCDKCNLDDPSGVIAELTMDEILEYTGVGGFSVTEDTDEATEDIFGNSGDAPEFGSIFDETENPHKESERKEDKNLPDAIYALQKQDTTNKDITMTRSLLSEDFKCLQTLFRENGSYEFQLELLTEKDNNGEAVITGYKLFPALYIDGSSAPRICPGSPNRPCDYPVFPFAGTAQHHRVVFFGPQESGKTSLLISLTHYATEGMKIALGENLWRNAERITAVKEISLLNRKDNLEQSGNTSDDVIRDRSLHADLDLFIQGIAPGKTDANRSSSAYSATLRLQDCNGKFHLLTMTDLPGELIHNTSGEIELSDLDTKFPTALSCDAYVVCFDTSKHATIQNQVNVTIDSVNTLQGLHAKKRGSNAHIPMIVVYTKCAELEQEETLPNPGQLPGGFGVAATHMFCGEWKKIREDEAYRYVFEQLNQSEHTKDAFKAALRCSAYGYPAPTQMDVKTGAAHHAPRPLYVDHLMKWILAVCCCIPVEGEFRKTFNSSCGWSEPNNFFSRLQLRKEKPISFAEALARTIMFANPGNIDEKFVQSYGSNLAEMRAKTEAVFTKEQK